MHHLVKSAEAFLECNFHMLTMSIKSEIKNQIATVTLNRPEVHNAFNAEMVTELTKIFTDLSKNKEVRSIILSSSGKTFCAGADLKWMQSMMNCSMEENIKDAENLAKMFATINNCSKPVIARVQGHAFGGGVGLISTCDIVISVETATFSLSEVRIGLVPGVISPFLLRKISVGEARRYFLTAEKFSANEALRIGLISKVVKDEAELDSVIKELTNNINQNGPEATSICKKMIFEVSDLNINEAITFTTKAIADRRAGKEGQEGMKSFFEKRKPEW